MGKKTPASAHTSSSWKSSLTWQSQAWPWADMPRQWLRAWPLAWLCAAEQGEACFGSEQACLIKDSFATIAVGSLGAPGRARRASLRALGQATAFQSGPTCSVKHRGFARLTRRSGRTDTLLDRAGWGERGSGLACKDAPLPRPRCTEIHSAQALNSFDGIRPEDARSGFRDSSS